MTAITLTQLLFGANAIAHIISVIQLRGNKETGAFGVLLFAIINALVAIYLIDVIDYAFIVPLVGLLGLVVTRLARGKGTIIDYVIAALDIAIIAMLLI